MIFFYLSGLVEGLSHAYIHILDMKTDHIITSYFISRTKNTLCTIFSLENSYPILYDT